MPVPPRRMPKLLLAALCVFTLTDSASLAAAEVYRWRDARGVVHHSDTPPRDAAAERVVVDTREPPPPAARAPVGAAPTAKPPPLRPPQQFEVVMSMRPDCGYCVRAERFFQQRGLAWTNHDVAASRQARTRFDPLGGRGTPLIYIDGQRVNGFDVARIDQLLAARGWQALR